MGKDGKNEQERYFLKANLFLSESIPGRPAHFSVCYTSSNIWDMDTIRKICASPYSFPQSLLIRCDMSPRDVDLKKYGIIPEPGLTHLSTPFLPTCFQICVDSEFEETVTGHYF